jgi:xanthine dehydrogenase accessory factor
VGARGSATIGRSFAVTTWVRALTELRKAREPGVLATVIDVRGHAPRNAGAKMVVSAMATWGTIGGGNLEQEGIRRARQLLEASVTVPETFTASLSDKAPFQHGVQCCGGEVTMLLEPLPVVPSIAIFGMGHVGSELARILARHDLDLHVVDSRPAFVAEEALAPLEDAVAAVHAHSVPVLPELVLAELPSGTHVLVLTHDHAEDLAICDAAIRTDHLGPIGLIGWKGKWARFRTQLAAAGHSDSAIRRIKCPMGMPGVQTSKVPAAIALSVASDLLITSKPQVGARVNSAAPDRSSTTTDRHAR